jgi:hypothetical protein
MCFCGDVEQDIAGTIRNLFIELCSCKWNRWNKLGSTTTDLNLLASGNIRHLSWLSEQNPCVDDFLFDCWDAEKNLNPAKEIDRDCYDCCFLPWTIPHSLFMPYDSMFYDMLSLAYIILYYIILYLYYIILYCIVLLYYYYFLLYYYIIILLYLLYYYIIILLYLILLYYIIILLYYYIILHYSMWLYIICLLMYTYL